ncbi:hypothetical protein GCM10023145_38940 [Angustibacter luteus]
MTYVWVVHASHEGQHADTDGMTHHPRLTTTFGYLAVGLGVLAFGLISAAGMSNMGDPGPGDSLEPPRIFYVLTACAGVAAVLAVAGGLASLGSWLRFRRDQA